MVRSPNTVPFLASQAPIIDPAETRWAAGEVAAILRQLGADSPAGLILAQAGRELDSLVRSAAAEPPTRVVGPYRLKAAA